MPIRNYYTTKETAEILGVTPFYVNNLARNNKIKNIRINESTISPRLFLKEDIQEYIDKYNNGEFFSSPRKIRKIKNLI